MPTAPTTPDRLNTTDPPILLAVLIAARKTGDRLLEQIARRQLEEQDIRVAFAAESFQRRGGNG